jgi:hypothetical protein
MDVGELDLAVRPPRVGTGGEDANSHERMSETALVAERDEIEVAPDWGRRRLGAAVPIRVLRVGNGLSVRSSRISAKRDQTEYEASQ